MLTQRRLGRKGWRKNSPSNYLRKPPDLTGELADVDKKSRTARMAGISANRKTRPS